MASADGAADDPGMSRDFFCWPAAPEAFESSVSDMIFWAMFPENRVGHRLSREATGA
jgi:hypothetical protein